MPTLQERAAAISKALLLQRILGHLSRQNFERFEVATPVVHAVAAHLIAASWIHASSWVARVPQATLAHRLNVHAGTIRRAIRALESTEIIRRKSGRGARRSVYILIEPPQPEGLSASAHTVCAPAHTPLSASAHTVCATEAPLSEQNSFKTGTPTTADRKPQTFEEAEAVRRQLRAQLALSKLAAQETHR